MSILPQVTFPAPTGMNSADDSVSMPANRARLLQNLSVSRNGQLRADVRLVDVLSGLPAHPDGLGWFYGLQEDGTGDRLLAVCAGSLWEGVPELPLTEPPTFRTVYAVGSGFATGKRVRSASYQQETIFVQEGGLQPLRFNGTHLYSLGIAAPAAPSVVAFGTGNKTGLLSYKTTLYDELGRESSPSPGTTHTFASQQALVSPDYGRDPQVVGAYVYVSTTALSVWYRIATLVKPFPSHTDNATDNTVSATVQFAPDPGQFDRPNPASCIAIHKNRIFINDLTVSGQMQVNNLDSPTKWASVSYMATDGTKFKVDTDQGDPVVAIVPYGSLLGVWKRRGLYQGWGDNPVQTTIRPIHVRGPTSADSCVRCDNLLIFLAEDGVYAAEFQSAFVLHKLSAEIEDFLPAAHPVAELERAVGWYASNRYHLAVGTRIYRFDLAPNPPGWGFVSL
jgi:hypothetical protein